MNFGSINEERIRKIRSILETKFATPMSADEVKKLLPGMLVRRTGVINLTKLNDTPFVLNAELIETVEATPDTVITLVNGRKYIAKEPVDEVRRRCVDYKREIHSNTT